MSRKVAISQDVLKDFYESIGVVGQSNVFHAVESRRKWLTVARDVQDLKKRGVIRINARWRFVHADGQTIARRVANGYTVTRKGYSIWRLPYSRISKDK